MYIEIRRFSMSANETSQCVKDKQLLVKVGHLMQSSHRKAF